MKDNPAYIIAYMFVTTAVFSGVLIGLSQATRARVEANEQLAVERAVLEALAVDTTAMNGLQIHAYFEQQVQPPGPGSAGAWRHIDEDGQLLGYAVPIDGQGFWAPIAGFLGVKADRETVTGVSFYEQRETPGLGAEITQPVFRDQFAGKQLGSGPRPLAIERMQSSYGPSEVQAVTGATQTSTRVGKFMNEDLVRWRDAMAGATSAGEGPS